jgi:hypothetical protein
VLDHLDAEKVIAPISSVTARVGHCRALVGSVVDDCVRVRESDGPAGPDRTSHRFDQNMSTALSVPARRQALRRRRPRARRSVDHCPSLWHALAVL